MDDAQPMGGRLRAEEYLDEFWVSLGQAIGGNKTAIYFWKKMLECVEVDILAVMGYLSLMDRQSLMRYGRTGALCLAHDALNSGDMARFAALCLHGISMEAR